jgi:hypothetical protein
MAGGYQHRPDGIEGLTKVLRDLQRQINELRGAAGRKSLMISEGGLTTFNPGSGARSFLGEGNLSLWADYTDNPDRPGLIYCDPDPALSIIRLFPPYYEGNGNENSLTIQGRREGLPGAAWIYTDGDLLLSADGTTFLRGGHFSLDVPKFTIRTPELPIYDLPTTSGSANLRLDTIGGVWTLGYISSSARYKTDIGEAVVDSREVINLTGRTWVDKHEMNNGPVGDVARDVGFVAEELDEQPSLRQFVEYDDQGRPDGVKYDRLSVALLQVVKDQQSQIDRLSERVDALETDTTPPAPEPSE